MQCSHSTSERHFDSGESEYSNIRLTSQTSLAVHRVESKIWSRIFEYLGEYSAEKPGLSNPNPGFRCRIFDLPFTAFHRGPLLTPVLLLENFLPTGRYPG